MKVRSFRPLRAAGLGAVVLALTGCGPGYGDLPLPGSAVAGDSYRLEVAFDDAVNLAEGAQVKVDGLSVGRVQKVRAEAFHAVADLDIEQHVTIPQGSTARLRYDTPLGELFIELDPSGTGAPLGDGDTITTAATSTAPSVEDTLAQASLLVNGGGLGELQTITEELNAAIGGREDVVRDVLDRGLELTRAANAGSKDLDALLRDLARASGTLAARREVFGEALEAVGPLADMLREDTPALSRLLRRTSAVTARANRVVGRTQDQTVQVLEQLGPILEEVLSVEPEFVHGLTALQQADAILSQMIPGDFIGLSALIHVDLSRLVGTSGGGTSPGGGGTGGSDGGGLLGQLPGLGGDTSPGDPLGGLLSGLGLGAGGTP